MRLRKTRFLFVYGLAPLGLVFAHTSDQTLRFGILISALGEALRVWANGHIAKKKSQSLVTSGPYAWMQHPLYTGTMLIGIGFCVMVGHWWFALVALLLFGLIYRRKIQEESSQLRISFGAQYAAYQQAVPLFWPRRLRPYAARSREPFLWANVAVSGECKTIVWLIVVLAVVYLHGEWVLEHERLQWKHLAVIVVAAALISSDVVAELATRWQFRPREQ